VNKMAIAEKHPIDVGKFQSTFDSYGTGEGNGKSRNAVYKYAKKIGWTEDKKEKIIVDSVQPKEKSEPELHKIDSNEWGEVGWFEESETPVEANTIPKPVADLASSKVSKMNAIADKSQRHLIRMGFTGVDRLVTHWGRGVMMDKEWEINRSKADLDALEESSMQVMQHYGINVELNPVMIWGVTVGSAYVPPIIHVQKNADPSKKGKGIVGRIITSIKNRRRFKRKNKPLEGEINA